MPYPSQGSTPPWPPAFSMATYAQGVNSILPSLVGFGTDGLYPGIIVKSARPSKMIEEVKWENGSGLTAGQIILFDGDIMELDCIDDRNVTWPQPGTTVTLYNPLPNGTAATQEVYMTLNNNYNAVQKQPGERTLRCVRYNLFSPTNM